jgi:hypothetical protein
MSDLKSSTKLFMDETRAPLLDPGARKTKPDTSGRLPAMTDRGAEQRRRVWSHLCPRLCFGLCRVIE